MTQCTHSKGWRFIACYCADRLPGVWVCDDCGETIKAHSDKYQKYPARVVPPNPFKRTSELPRAS